MPNGVLIVFAVGSFVILVGARGRGNLSPGRTSHASSDPVALDEH